MGEKEGTHVTNKGIAIIFASCLVCVVLVYNAMHGEILTNPN